MVDLIRGFTDPRSRLAADLDGAVEATRPILDAARAAGAPCILAGAGYGPELERMGVWAAKIPSTSWLTEGSEWVEFDERLGRASISWRVRLCNWIPQRRIVA